MNRRHLLLALGSLLGAGFGGCAGRPVHDAGPLPLFQLPPPATISAAPQSSPYRPLPPPVPPPQPPPAAEVAPPPAPDMDAHVQQGAHNYPTPPTPPPPEDVPAVAALRCLLQDKQTTDAVTLLKNYRQPNQDLLMALLLAVARVSAQDAARNDPHATAVTVEVLEGCLERLRRNAALVLDKMCFCRWIDKFGVYEPLPEGHPFAPGSQVHVYVELRNFASEPADHCFETRLASRVTILDTAGQTVQQWTFNDRNRPERSQSPRHDYFINYSLPLPRDLKPGKYRLLLHVDDLPTQRSAEQTLELNLTTRPVAGP